MKPIKPTDPNFVGPPTPSYIVNYNVPINNIPFAAVTSYTELPKFKEERFGDEFVVYTTPKDTMVVSGPNGLIPGFSLEDPKWNARNLKMYGTPKKEDIDRYATQTWPVVINKYKGFLPRNKKTSFEEYYQTVPAEKNDTTSYNLRRAFELAPDEELRDFVKNPNAHLSSVYFNKETGEYEFMKRKDHPTVQLELDWYNSSKAKNFRKQYQLDTSGDYYKYIPK